MGMLNFLLERSINKPGYGNGVIGDSRMLAFGHSAQCSLVIVPYGLGHDEIQRLIK